MGMTLAQAIKKYETEAENFDRVNYSEKAAERRQLVTWLKELQIFKDAQKEAEMEWQEMLREVRARG